MHDKQVDTRLILNKIRAACTRFQITSLTRQIKACEELAAENQVINVAILGQFKAGKTSFINSLIGTSVLPVGVIPVTTVITRITRVQYGARERAMVTFLDGRKQEITLQDIEDYISEAKNPANQRNVAVVDIELPVFEHYHGLRLVDTPGLGSVFKYNTATSEEWLPKVGAAIVAISSDRPLSERDLALLQELTEYTPEVVLLLTKVDLLTPEQQNEVVRFLNGTMQREFNHVFPVFLYSTKSDTDQYRQHLDAGLFIPLSQNVDLELKEISRHKITALARSCIGYLEIARQASAQADISREDLKNLILDEKVNYDLIRSELFLIARENMIQTRQLIKQHLDNTQRLPLTRTISTKLKNAMPSWRGNLSKFTRQYEHWLMETMTEELQQVSKAEHRHFWGTLEKAQAAIHRSLMLFKNLLDRNIENVLSIKLSDAEWKIQIPEPDHPDVSVTRSFDFHLDMLWFLIPMVIFRKSFERHFLKQIPWLVEVNLSRLAYQWEININKAIEDIKNRALIYIQEELATVENLLSRVEGKTDELTGIIRDLESSIQ
jgi:GTP-binding protein EngB required for normal cell division